MAIERKMRSFAPAQAPAETEVVESPASAPAGGLAGFARNFNQSAPAVEEPEEQVVTDEVEVEVESESEGLPIAEDSETSSFTVVDIEDEKVYAGEWSADMDIPSYIGSTEMLLNYLHELEGYYKVTMPIKACGIDPILFENAEPAYPGAGQNNNNFFAISDEDEDEEEVKSPEGDEPAGKPKHYYELIKVDNVYYFSCVTDCVDEDYLKAILAEATASIRTSGTYVFQMVGFRKLSAGENEESGKLLKTLRLNTYEMSILVKYMSGFKGMHISYKTEKDGQVILFTVK